MADDARVDRIVGMLGDKEHNRSAARDIVSHLQCFDAAGKPLFTTEQIQRICNAVGDQAEQAANEGDDRRLKRMVDALLKLSTVNQKLQELQTHDDEAADILARLRDRQRAASAN